MIDAMFQEGTDQAIADQVQRPKPAGPPPPAPGVFAGFGGALLGGGLAAGAYQTGAFAADMLGAFGQTLAATDGRAGGMFAGTTPAERTQQEKARAKLVEPGGINFSSPTGDRFRQRAADMMPDPMTTGLAAQLVAGLYRFGGKAVGYSMLGGPVVGALGMVGDEAFTEADKLKHEGVDLGTRSAVGAVAGVASGLAMALPVAGKTIKSTAALVVAGGPGSFMAQQAASRAILEHADYSKIGSTYDPLDPVGLGVALGGAGLMAGIARAARARGTLADTVQHLESRGNRYGKDGKLLTSPKGAQGEMQVMPGTSGDPGFGVAPARDKSPEELARVGRDYIAAMQKRYGDDAQALAAYNAGPGAVDKAIKTKGGEWLSVLPKETRDYVANGMRRQGADAVRAATEARPELIRAARVQQVQHALADGGLHAPDDLAGASQHFDAVARASDQLAAGETVHVGEVAMPETVTLYRGQRIGGEPGHMQGGAVWTTRDAGEAGRYAASEGAGRGEVVQHEVTLERPFVLNEESAGRLAQFYESAHHDAPTNARNVADMAAVLKKDGLSFINAEVRQKLRDAGYDSIVVEKEGGVPGKSNAVVLLKKPEEMRGPRGRLADFARAVDDLRAREAPAAAPARATAAPPPAIHDTLTEARRTLADRTPEQALADIEAKGGKATPLQNNALIAAHEVRGDAVAEQQLLSHYAAETARDATLPPEDALATAVESVRSGKAVEPAPYLDRAVAEALAAQPDMHVQLEGMEHSQPAAEIIDMVRREAAQDVADSDFLRVAAECFLRGG